jgi:hypothetical protein
MTLADFLDFTFYSGWTFFGMLLLITALSGLLKGLFSFIPKRIHFGGVQHIQDTSTKETVKKARTKTK